jgi:hypothetical protein
LRGGARFGAAALFTTNGHAEPGSVDRSNMAKFEKATSSRILRGQVLPWAGTGTSISTFFGPQTFQVRVISQINGYISIDQTTGTSLLSTSTFSGGMFIAANTANGDYLTVTPGQYLTFTSSTTGTTGSSIISVSEMN